MKILSLLVLVILVSCNPATTFKPIPKTPSTPVPVPTQPVKHLDSSTSHDFVVEIDQVNNIFTITGMEGRVCGIDMIVVDRLKWELIDAEHARLIHMDRDHKPLRTFELTRVDGSNNTKIFGDWETEITSGDSRGYILWHIKLDPVMNVENDCVI